MNIKKLGHCCLVLSVDGKTIVTDPGNYTTAQNELVGVDAVVITHDHQDHFHAESVQAIVKNNPNVAVIANTAVGKKLDELGIAHTVLDGTTASTTATIAGITFEAFDAKHEEIYEEIGQVQNTAYIIAGKVLLPGDAYAVPADGKAIEILALPIAGPWCKISDAIRYAIRVKPNSAIPIHDAMLKQTVGGFMYAMLGQILGGKGITIVPMGENDEKEF